jgi:hypothetical protein
MPLRSVRQIRLKLLYSLSAILVLPCSLKRQNSVSMRPLIVSLAYCSLQIIEREERQHYVPLVDGTAKSSLRTRGH